MNAERILIAAECVGDAKWFIDRASAYAKERIVFDRPIGRNQGVQFPIAKAYANMRAAELMMREAARLYESNTALLLWRSLTDYVLLAAPTCRGNGPSWTFVLATIQSAFCGKTPFF